MLQAWHDVVNALVAHRLEQTAARGCGRRPITPARRSIWPRALQGRRHGFLNVLDAERSLLQADQQYAASTTNVSLDLVQLFKALGGGWETQFPDVPSETAAVPVPVDFVDRAVH